MTRVTAETITDEQIDLLWIEAAGSGSFRDANPDLMHDCTVARDRHGDFTPSEIGAAVARCVAAWNARHAKEANHG